LAFGRHFDAPDATDLATDAGKARYVGSGGNQ
jgi:hypothetical protein